MGARTRTVLGATVLALAISACGSSGHQSAATTTSAPATTTTTAQPPSPGSGAATTTTTAAGGGPCPTSRLTAGLAAGGGGAAGSFGETLELRNAGSSTCSLTGYPGVSFVAGVNGAQVGHAAVRQPGTPVTAVILAPGQVARAALLIIDSGNYDQSTCHMTAVRGLRVYPPNQYTALFVPSPQKACSNPRDITLNVGPVTAP